MTPSNQQPPKQKHHTQKLMAIALSIALVGAACGSSDGPETNALPSDDNTSTTATPTTSIPATSTSTPSAPTTSPSGDSSESSVPAADSGDPIADTAALLKQIGDRYTAATDLWPGFVPNDHPTVLAVKNDQRDLLRVIALNHPSPEKLGAATKLDTTGTPFSSAYEIKNAADINEADQKKLSNMVNFEFHVTLGGVDSFAIDANNDLGVKNGDFAATLIHEMFHRWQDSGFKEGLGNQDVENYAFTKENLELAVLEQRALTAAIDAPDADAKMTAARHYAALRLSRRHSDNRIDLDDRQELIEGSARYVEHASHTEGGAYGRNDFTAELGNEFATSSGVKEWFAFGRFYSTGAATIHLADQLGADDVLNRVSAGGEFPADLVIKASGVTTADVATLVAEARSTYDSDGAVAKAAAHGEERAKAEGGVFDDAPGAGDGTGGPVPGDEGIALTSEQEKCLTDAGIGDGGVISDEVFEKCIGG